MGRREGGEGGGRKENQEVEIEEEKEDEEEKRRRLEEGVRDGGARVRGMNGLNVVNQS